MKWLSSIVGLIIAAVGVMGMAAPTALMDGMRFVQTQVGLYIVAALRVAFGLVLIGAAAGSRLPKTLRVLGAFVIVAGIVTPLFGVDRARAIIDWWTAQGTAFIRGWAVLAVIFGLFIIYAVGIRRQTD